MHARVTLAAALLLAVGFGLGARTASWAVGLERTSGLIEKVHPSRPPQAELPVTVAFDGRDGTRYRVRTTARPGLVLGSGPAERVDVFYDARDPVRTARIDSLWRVWLWPGLCVAAGLLLLVLREQEGDDTPRRPAGRPSPI